MKNLYLYLMIVTLAGFGCTSPGAFLSPNQTIVNLNESNYSLTATNVSGEAEAAYVLVVDLDTVKKARFRHDSVSCMFHLNFQTC